jgi:hypothetical protein
VIRDQPFQFAAGSAWAAGATVIPAAIAAVAAHTRNMSLLAIFQRMQTPLTISLQTVPGPVGLMLGEKELPPPTAFSVGETAGEDDGGVDGGVVELVAGASFSVVGLQLVMAPTATRAAPAPISRLRVKPPEVMRASLHVGRRGLGERLG